ncbi:MAG: GNAT family N-acetyltransferase [Leeuwenhoekiella sp.]
MANTEYLIRPARTENLQTIRELALKIWPPTFGGILSAEQIDYMLEMMYSLDSLREQQTNGHKMFLMFLGEKAVGYLSLEHHLSGKWEHSFTKVHKIYLLPQEQGKGAGKTLMDHAFAEAKQKGDHAVMLNVNRFNKSVGFYERYGFETVATEDIDIGNGFLMEDFVMQCPIR